jgi:CMP-N,N'-diacetyllegionaminic acid synthase
LTGRLREVLGIVPARGGSKSIPRKNLHPVAGKPLIAYTFDAARESQRLTRTILSTDDEEIAQAGRLAGIEVPFMRPAELAADDAPTLPVLQHALSFLRAAGYRPDAVVILQPTSPLRRAEHIDHAVEILEEGRCDSVVSVVQVPHNFHPMSVMTNVDGFLFPYLGGEGTRVLRRQDKPTVFARNGAAVYAVLHDTITEQGSLFGDRCRPLEMSAEDSVDVDGPFDLVVAETLLRQRARRAATNQSPV